MDDFTGTNLDISVGLSQYIQNQADISAMIDAAANQSGTGKVILVGHSLGGALAQIAACDGANMSQIERIVTFQAPGIPHEILAELLRYNHRNLQDVLSTHYRVDGDIVDNAGEVSTPGEIVRYGNNVDALSAHTSLPVTQEAAERGLLPRDTTNSFRRADMPQRARNQRFSTDQDPDRRGPEEDIRRLVGELLEVLGVRQRSATL